MNKMFSAKMRQTNTKQTNRLTPVYFPLSGKNVSDKCKISSSCKSQFAREGGGEGRLSE